MTEIRKRNISASELSDEANALQYIVSTLISDTVNTIDLVRVVAVKGDKLDVIPIIKKLDNNNLPIQETTIYDIPYIKLQAGDKLLDLTPELGDVGLILICKRDSSSPLAGIVNSRREFNYNDGVYLGSLFGLGKQVKRKISFTEQGIDIDTQNENDTIKISTPKSSITIDATGVKNQSETAVTMLDDKLSYKNAVGDLYAAVNALMSACLAIKGADNVTLHADSIQAFTAVQQQFENILKAGA